MDKPVRKYQKQKDYQRHKLFRKMKRRRKAAIEQAKDAPMKPLRRKFKIPKFEGGKDDKPNVFQLPDGTFVNNHNEPLEVLDYAGVEDPTKWTYVDKKGNRYTPKAARTLTEGEQFTQRQIENEKNNRPFEFTPYIEGANEGAAAASLMMGFPFNMAGSAYYTAKASRDAYNRNYLGAALNSLGAVTPAGSGILQSVKRLLPKEKTLGQLAKSMFNEAALAIENYRYPLGRPQVPEGYITVEPQIRTRIGDVEIDNPGLYYHQSAAGKAENFVSTGRMRTPLEESWLAKEKAGEHIPIMLRTGVTPGYPQNPGRAMFAQGRLWYGLDTRRNPDLLVTAEEMPIANSKAGVMSSKASLKKLESQGSRRVTDDNIYGQGPHNTQNTAAYTWEPGYGYRRVFAEETPTVEWADAVKTPQITAENATSITPETIRLYHGSPVRFNTFSANFIGSGEGGSKVMRGINLWPEEKIGNAPKLANIKSPDAPMHLGVSSTPLGGELNPTVYDVLGKDLKLYKAAPREVKSLKQEDLVKQGYDGVQTPNQVTVFPESIHKLSIDKQSSIEDFVMSHPEVERWTPWTTDMQKMQNIIDISRMSKYTPEQWTAAQDAAIARGDMSEAQRLRDLHFQVSAPNTAASVNGQPLQLYHGTNATFNTFDLSKYGSTDGGTFGRGVYTTPVKEYAELYGKNNMPLYMKLDNPRDYRNSSIGDIMAEKFAFGDDFATGNGIDGVVGRPSWKGFKGLEEYISHNPKNIKSSLAVTYGPDGTRIPLGSRDNFNINDIRYGLLAPLAGGTALLGYNSLGQPVDTYKHGKDSGIHINPKNRGKFNALKKRTGKTTEQLTHSKNPLTRKRAIFALNSKKWKH